MHQLDLFLPAPPRPAEWFPVQRRRRFISNVARILLDREGGKRQKRWRLECTRLECELIVAGIRDRVFITAELASFKSAVEAEMCRQIIEGVSRSQRGGAV
ncbi:DUF6074 family protein [Pseudaminobacter salicylatoxidans]|uniref:DUF6074 family protein n=1 Tax=Pseudaminobacter salicylatoxidans TaxID=93369 RepID=UPI0011B1D74F|nr:DUF6074 family protein [Pseudaminobacter salicylatoxidans]